MAGGRVYNAGGYHDRFGLQQLEDLFGREAPYAVFLQNTVVLQEAHQTTYHPQLRNLAMLQQVIPVRRPADHVQRALTGAVQLATTRALSHLSTFILGQNRQDLPQQALLRR